MPIADLAIATGTLAGDVLRTPPTVVLTAPTGVVTTTSATATWTFASSIGRAQAAYRLKLRTVDGSVVFYDSGTVLGAGATAVIPFLLASSSTYVVAVTVYDGLDWSPEATITFSVDIGNVNAYPDNLLVGSVYEIAINGVGYMLQDLPDAAITKDRRYKRTIEPLTAPRFSTGSTPLAESVDRYTFVPFTDYTLGTGQRLRDRPASVSNAYRDSENVDPFTVGQLSLLPTSLNMGSGSAGPLYMCVASDVLYVVTGANTIKAHTTLGGAATTFTIALAGTISGMTSDGTNWYVTDGVKIWKGATAADPGAAWSTVVTNLLAWATDRIVCSVIASGSTPNQVQSLTPLGAVEIIFKTLPAGTTVRSITSGNGYVWFCADQFDASNVWAYQLGTAAGTTFSAFQLPQGQTCMKVSFYQNNVMLRARENSAVGNRAIIYRSITSNGSLIPTRLLEIATAIDNSGGDFAGDDRFIAFSWRQMSAAGNTGFGLINLATGGYSKWLSSTTGGVPVAIVNWKGQWVYSVAGEGVLYKSTVPSATGWLRTSLSDLSSQLTKVLDNVRLTTDALPSNSSVQVKYTADGGATYTSAGILSTAGSKTSTYPIGYTTNAVAIEITLNTTNPIGPVVRAVVIQLHPLELADQIVILPINCSDIVAGANKRPIPEMQSAGSGAARTRVLEELMSTRVRFQDVDWPATRTAGIFEVVKVDVESVNMLERHRAVSGQAQHVSLTLRRAFR